MPEKRHGDVLSKYSEIWNPINSLLEKVLMMK